MTTPIIQATKDKGDIKYEEWMESIVKDYKVLQKDMNKLVMDYFIKEGFKDVAEKFEIESETQANINLNKLDERVKIRKSIENGDIDSSITLINDKYPELLDDNRYLFFQLQQQQLIELIRQKRIEDALIFAQNNLAEYGEDNSEVLDQLEKTLALLAFDEPEKSPFGDLLSHNHKQKISSDIIAAISNYENLSSSPECNLSNVLKLLLWCQSDLTGKKISFPKMTDISQGIIPIPTTPQEPKK
ncbi:unnamed protein product [Gordionus sp. m RMFG-2023]|uniref:glucose-induced degradation protein 8 homolog n=1 Tax=Gordionus sp. m RMFG-2023 TaxID=3053472 RepID=UPI0030E510F2